jgi:phosphoglycolate phosphatase
LVSLAQRRVAERTGVYFDNDHTVLIGDTPNDVRAALAAGVQIIAVATGKSSINELIRAGATSAVTHLGEVSRTWR